jgi:hypothetical protein
MNKTLFNRLMIFGLIFSFGTVVSIAQTSKDAGTGSSGSGLFGKSVNNKEVNIKEPKVVKKSKRAQEAKEKKMKMDYDRSIKESQKRTIEIQTPAVQERMKQNRKETVSREKARKRKERSTLQLKKSGTGRKGKS